MLDFEATAGRVPLDALAVPRRSGTEPFTLAGAAAGAVLTDFWAWACSDVMSNRLRGVLAEYIVALAMGAGDGVRTEWDAVDLRLPGGLDIEVKSAAYMQSWSQQRPSRIEFNVAPTKGWDARTDSVAAVALRPSRVYVFCLLHHTDKATVDPLDLDQWEFYVTPTAALDAALGTQARVSLARLRTITPTSVTFGELEARITECAATPT
ncbi:hypothetical protein IL992_17030 [Microbispora sp. NEAU-D428]|uniref:hypothetical protein n=1 Tax=Microbispora sitophila TaxID=2771537 RepID=UPI00186672A7|nr:hypothetical protein [Microbispora sitophila]MBE3010883.1 hypothetical protein [Microbispora sitophila]